MVCFILFLFVLRYHEVDCFDVYIAGKMAEVRDMQKLGKFLFLSVVFLRVYCVVFV